MTEGQACTLAVVPCLVLYICGEEEVGMSLESLPPPPLCNLSCFAKLSSAAKSESVLCPKLAEVLNWWKGLIWALSQPETHFESWTQSLFLKAALVLANTLYCRCGIQHFKSAISRWNFPPLPQRLWTVQSKSSRALAILAAPFGRRTANDSRLGFCPKTTIPIGNLS